MFIKLWLIGAPGVGKTQLLNRFTNTGYFSGAYTRTVAPDFAGCKVKLRSGHQAIVQLWDGPGGSRSESLHKWWLNTHVVVLVCEMTKRSSLDALTELLSQFRKVNYKTSDTLSVVLLINKAESGNQLKQEVFPRDVNLFCEANNVSLFYETSAAFDTNIVLALLAFAELGAQTELRRRGLSVMPPLRDPAIDTKEVKEAKEAKETKENKEAKQDSSSGASSQSAAASVPAATAGGAPAGTAALEQKRRPSVDPTASSFADGDSQSESGSRPGSSASGTLALSLRSGLGPGPRLHIDVAAAAATEVTPLLPASSKAPAQLQLPEESPQAQPRALSSDEMVPPEPEPADEHEDGLRIADALVEAALQRQRSLTESVGSGGSGGSAVMDDSKDRENRERFQRLQHRRSMLAAGASTPGYRSSISTPMGPPMSASGSSAATAASASVPSSPAVGFGGFAAALAAATAPGASSSASAGGAGTAATPGAGGAGAAAWGSEDSPERKREKCPAHWNRNPLNDDPKLLERVIKRSVFAREEVEFFFRFFHQRAVLPLSDFELLLGRLLHGQTQAQAQAQSQAQGQAAALASAYYPASLVAMPVQVWRALADRLFVAFDRQQRGGVDFEDFVAGMTTLCKGTLEQKAAFVFKLYDYSKVALPPQKQALRRKPLYPASHHSDGTAAEDSAADGGGGSGAGSLEATPHEQTRTLAQSRPATADRAGSAASTHTSASASSGGGGGVGHAAQLTATARARLRFRQPHPPAGPSPASAAPVFVVAPSGRMHHPALRASRTQQQHGHGHGGHHGHHESKHAHAPAAAEEAFITRDEVFRLTARLLESMPAVQKLLTIGQRLADVRKAMEPAVTAAVDDLLAKLEGCEDNYTVAESRFVAAATKNPDLMAVFVAV